MFMVNNNPRSRYLPFVGSAFTDLPPDLHLIDDDNSSNCSDKYDNDIPAAADNAPSPTTTNTADANDTTSCLPYVPVNSKQTWPPVWQPTLPRSRVSVCPTNLACQLESELWAACLGHCGEDQLHSLANRADGLPNSFKFHPFCHIDWKEQAQIRKRAACCITQKVNDVGARFYMDFWLYPCVLH